jgi:hypothetical protein
MHEKQQMTKKRLSDISLREADKEEYEFIGPKRNNKPKYNHGKKES